MKKITVSRHVKEGLRIVAVFEAAKGLLVLLAGFGVLASIHRDLHAAAAKLIGHFHLNPASRYPRIFINLADHATDGQLWLLALSALFYSLVRFAEAYGLWRGRHWAEWLALVTSGLFIPLELFEVTSGPSGPKLTLLMVNSGIVAYLSLVLYSRRKRRQAGRAS